MVLLMILYLVWVVTLMMKKIVLKFRSTYTYKILNMKEIVDRVVN